MAKVTKIMMEQEKRALQERINLLDNVNTNLKRELTSLKDRIKMIGQLFKGFEGSE